MILNQEKPQKNFMTYGKCVGNDWLAEHQEEMIYCPNQPGHLIISKKACVQRYRAARRKVLIYNLAIDDFFEFTIKKGFARCRECPVGKRLAFACSR